MGYYVTMKKGTYIEVGHAFANEAKGQIPNIHAGEFSSYLEWIISLAYETDQVPNTYGIGGIPLPDIYGYAYTLYLSGCALNAIMKQIRQTT